MEGVSPTLVFILDADVIAGVQGIGQVKVISGCGGQKDAHIVQCKKKKEKNMRFKKQSHKSRGKELKK